MVSPYIFFLKKATTFLVIIILSPVFFLKFSRKKIIDLHQGVTPLDGVTRRGSSSSHLTPVTPLSASRPLNPTKGPGSAVSCPSRVRGPDAVGEAYSTPQTP